MMGRGAELRNQLGVLLIAVVFIFAAPSSGRASDLFRVFLEGQANGFYGDNIPLRTNNEIGDFGTVLVAGFYLDYTSAARYTALHYDTFAQLFTHQTRFDRAGQGQFVNFTDDENLSPTTKLRIDELYYRDATVLATLTASDQSPQFNSALALLLLANQQASINQFNAELVHDWSKQWTSDLSVHQTTYFAASNNTTQDNYSFEQSIRTDTDYHFSGRFSVGGGYRYYDWRFTTPGLPGEQAHWPFARASWKATENLYLSGIVGLVISHTQGQSGEHVDPAGIGLIEYQYKRATVSLSGGQEPSLNSAFGGVGELRGFRGNIVYQFTPRLTGNVGGSYYDSSGSTFSGQFASWGVGVSERVNKWLSLNSRFIQVRQDDTGSNQFFPSSSGVTKGQWAVGNYYIVGLAVSFEAFRWSSK
jgi:hypothetical protein